MNSPKIFATRESFFCRTNRTHITLLLQNYIISYFDATECYRNKLDSNFLKLKCHISKSVVVICLFFLLTVFTVVLKNDF
jgi:hypothetical protein